MASAAATGALGPRQLRAALDSSPLRGAERGEDTYNLLGHTLRKAVGVIVRQQGRWLLAVANEAASGMIVAVGGTPANAPEASMTEAIEADLAAQQRTLRELHIDRAYLASTLVQERVENLTIFCKAWPVRQGPYFPKSAFQLDWQRQELRCLGGELMPFELEGW